MPIAAGSRNQQSSVTRESSRRNSLSVAIGANLDNVARYAYRQGVFVLAQSGDTVVILNDKGFQPQRW